MIPNPPLETAMELIGSLVYRFCEATDITYDWKELKPGSWCLIFTVSRKHILTTMEEEMLVDAFGDVADDCGYKKVATYDHGIDRGHRLLLEQVYKKA